MSSRPAWWQPVRGCHHAGFFVAVFASTSQAFEHLAPGPYSELRRGARPGNAERKSIRRPGQQNLEGSRKGNLLRYLRFNPDEYQVIVGLWHQLDLGGRRHAAVKRLLAAALVNLSPKLAWRITRLRRGELDLLSAHFQARAPAGVAHDFTPEELRVVASACVSPPFRVRFVRSFKGVLVELLQESWPDLSRKVARLSGYQFERLYEQASRESRERD